MRVKCNVFHYFGVPPYDTWPHPNSTKKFAMEGKNENLCPHWNTQYFAAASNEFQFPNPEVKTWIINEWCISFGPVIRRSRKSKADSWLRQIGPYVISLIIHVVIIFRPWKLVSTNLKREFSCHRLVQTSPVQLAFNDVYTCGVWTTMRCRHFA